MFESFITSIGAITYALLIFLGTWHVLDFIWCRLIKRMPRVPTLREQLFAEEIKPVQLAYLPSEQDRQIAELKKEIAQLQIKVSRLPAQVVDLLNARGGQK